MSDVMIPGFAPSLIIFHRVEPPRRLEGVRSLSDLKGALELAFQPFPT